MLLLFCEAFLYHLFEDLSGEYDRHVGSAFRAFEFAALLFADSPATGADFYLFNYHSKTLLEILKDYFFLLLAVFFAGLLTSFFFFGDAFFAGGGVITFSTLSSLFCDIST